MDMRLGLDLVVLTQISETKIEHSIRRLVTRVTRSSNDFPIFAFLVPMMCSSRNIGSGSSCMYLYNHNYLSLSMSLCICFPPFPLSLFFS